MACGMIQEGGFSEYALLRLYTPFGLVVGLVGGAMGDWVEEKMVRSRNVQIEEEEKKKTREKGLR